MLAIGLRFFVLLAVFGLYSKEPVSIANLAKASPQVHITKSLNLSQTVFLISLTKDDGENNAVTEMALAVATVTAPPIEVLKTYLHEGVEIPLESVLTLFDKGDVAYLQALESLGIAIINAPVNLHQHNQFIGKLIDAGAMITADHLTLLHRIKSADPTIYDEITAMNPELAS